MSLDDRVAALERAFAEQYGPEGMEAHRERLRAIMKEVVGPLLERVDRAEAKADEWQRKAEAADAERLDEARKRFKASLMSNLMERGGDPRDDSGQQEWRDDGKGGRHPHVLTNLELASQTADLIMKEAGLW